MTGLTHLRSIEITAADPALLVDFYEETWGLNRLPSSSDDHILLRAGSSEHHVLGLVRGEGRALSRISLGAGTPMDVDDIAARLRLAKVEILSEPGPRTEPGGGYSVEFLDPEGRRIEVSADVEENEVDDSHENAGPDRLSHIVLNSVDLQRSVNFYTDVLGFTISDWYEDDQMIFLRCNTKHHCVVLAPGKWTSLNHVAFEVASGDQVMRALGRIRKAGFDSIWGPGRHGPGGNVFCYFIDPAGNVIEYTAELLEIGEDWEAKSWARTSENADVWGTSGGISPEIIAAMSNPPAGNS